MYRLLLRAVVVLSFVSFFTLDLPAQNPSASEVLVQAPLRRVEAPSADASPEALQLRGDELRAEKYYLDALDYYHAALKKKAGDSTLYNRMGICELLLQRWNESKKDFQRAIKANRQYADAYNNLGVVEYERRKYRSAIKQYRRAIRLRADSSSYYSNLGAAYFSRKDYTKAVMAYAHALQLDPDVFERTSRTGVSAQIPSPEDRARYDYVMAKLYAQYGATDRSLEHLRRAMEEGYKDIDNVYKDKEFTALRKDPRFGLLMASRPTAIPN